MAFKSLVAMALVSVAGRAQARGADQPLLLEVYVNGQSTGRIGEFILRDKELLVRRSELTALGFRQPHPLKFRETGVPSSDELIPLTEVPNLTSRIDATTQSLYVTVSNELLLPTSIEIDDGTLSNQKFHVESGTGTTMNYEVTSTLLGAQKTINGSLDMRFFSPRGVLSSGSLGYVSSSVGGGAATTSLVRLDSTYTIGDISNLRRYSLGDFITSGLSWTRPVRLEGLQVRSDFSMRPDLVTFPLPAVSGAAAVPSAVDVLTNGNLVVSRQIDAGPFEIPQLPVVSGAGTIALTLTNALGEQVRVVQPFYASAALLRPGLQNFSVQAGLVRLNWGVVSNEFGKAAVSTTYRRGMTPKFTVEGDAEVTPGILMAGGGGLLQVSTLGVLNFAAAGSAGSGGSGGQLSLGAQRIGRFFSIGASAMAASPSFKDVAAKNGDVVPRSQTSANVSFSLKRAGSLGIVYAGINRANSVNSVTRNVTPAQKTNVVSASYTHPFRHMSFFVNAFESLGGGTSPGVQIGLTIPLGQRQSIEASGGSDGSVQLQAQRSATTIGDWGYQAYAADGGGAHEFAQAQYKARYGLLTAGVDDDSGVTSVRLGTQGAVSIVDGGVFPSNTIYDSFAIVDTGTTARVHVLQENRDVGSTGSSGRLLVPDLRSYDVNRIAIVPTDIGLDTTIREARREVRPQDRSGIVVRFPVEISHAALLQLTDEAGEPVPLGSTARLRGSRQAVPVGYDGDAYVEDLKPYNEIEILLPDGNACVAVFRYKPLPGEIPRIGPLRCIELNPQKKHDPSLQSSLEGTAKVTP